MGLTNAPCPRMLLLCNVSKDVHEGHPLYSYFVFELMARFVKARAFVLVRVAHKGHPY